MDLKSANSVSLEDCLQNMPKKNTFEASLKKTTQTDENFRPLKSKQVC